MQVQSVLKNARWASRILSGKDSQIKVYLTTFPGVIGGPFRTTISGLTPDLFGPTNITITCTSFDSGDVFDALDGGTAGIGFQEIKSFSLQELSIDIMFRIPYEEQGTEEGSIWQLLIQFANGVTEIFEIPVCKTDESNPEMTSVYIASTDVDNKERRQSGSKDTSDQNPIESYLIERSRGKLALKFPSHTPERKPTLAKGLGVFIGLWAVMTAILYWLFDGPLELITIFGSLIIFGLVVLVFLLFGVSYFTLDKEKLVTTHRLFGIPLNWSKTNRDLLEGFSTKFLAATALKEKSQLDYFVMAETKNVTKVLLCLRIFSQEEAQLLARQLNDYLKNSK